MQEAAGCSLAGRTVRTALLAAGVVLLLGSCATQPEAPASAGTRPDILLIVADDLGWSDLGAWGGEIETPQLDALARRGLRLTNFHTAPTCSPTRAMLLTGVDHHRAGMGAMTETLAFVPQYRGRPGYEGHLNQQVVTVAELLRDAGYATLVSGKWHIGYETPDLPPARGFQRSFVLLQAGAQHFDGGPLMAMDRQSGFRADGAEATWPAGRYSSDYFTDQMLDFLRQVPREQPVFAYVAYTAPHWPLQAPDELIRKYENRYAGGPAVLRRERLERLRRLGLLADDDHAADPPVSTAEWSALPEAERARQARIMAVYAAMVDSMDRNVGRLLDEFRRSGRLANTVIVFLSDNGAEAMEAESAPLPGLREWIAQNFDNSLANVGRPGSYISQGRFWAPLSNLPFRGVKGATHEGGIRTAAFVVLPSGAQGRIDAYTHVLDLTPTFLTLAGVRHPGTEYQERSVFALEGRLLPLPGLAAAADAGRVASFELFGNRATQAGNLKVVSPWRGPGGSAPWQLFNLSRDPGERQDLAAGRPDDVARLVALHETWARDAGVVMPAPGFPGYGSR
ncbi:MAG: arylsulfatase [Gammaproteobacteria bacterium]|nr:arylsulfatase [Gammaproteobacteria bacterium]